MAVNTKLKGSETPRLFTPPLRKLTRHTSMGFDVIEWAEQALSWKPLPWQRWLLIRALELKPDKTFRFTTVLLMVARQNGKTSLLTILSLYWLTHGIPLVLGTSSSLDTAREGWENAVDYALDLPDIFGKPKVRRSNGDWQLTVGRNRFKVASASRRGGRGLSVGRLIEDELREHHEWLAHAAAFNSTVAVANSQVWLTSNAGDNTSVVLDHFRALGISGEDETLGFFEWSGPEDCEIADRQAWAQANPSLGYTISEESLISALAQQPASIFRTENLCQSVPTLDEVVTTGAWDNCFDAGDLSSARSRVALCLDVAPDLKHATLVAAAALPDGRTRVETVRAWTDTNSLRRDLPELLGKVKPASLGWFPSGPAASLTTELIKIKKVHPFTQQETNAVCQGLAESISAGRIAQSGDELLTSHILSVKKLKSGDGWKFSRRDGGHSDAAYAMAGAVHLAKSMPETPKLRLMVATVNNR